MSDTVYERARGVDREVGRIMETLQKARIYDKTIISLVCDHGLRDTQNNNDIRETLAGYGFKVLGNLSLVYGIFILLLILIPNSFSGRLSILACGLVVSGTGLILRSISAGIKKKMAIELQNAGNSK